MDPWVVASDERAKHDAQFATLTQGTHITGQSLIISLYSCERNYKPSMSI